MSRCFWARLDDPKALADAASGCFAVYHVAADYRLWVRDPDAAVCRQCRGHAAADGGGARRPASSASSIPAASPRWAGTPMASPPMKSTPSTLVGHDRALQALQIHGRGSGADSGARARVAGGDRQSVDAGRARATSSPRRPAASIIEAASGRMPAYVDTGLNLVHVDDVAAGHLLAESKGRAGERYILGGENLTLAEILRDHRRDRGSPSAQDQDSAGRALAGGAGSPRARAHLTGAEPFTTRDGLRMARNRMFFSSAKAERELGYRPRPAARRTGRRDSLVPPGGDVPMNAGARPVRADPGGLGLFAAGPGIFLAGRRGARAGSSAALAARRRHRPGARRSRDAWDGRWRRCWPRIIPANSRSCWWTTTASDGTADIARDAAAASGRSENLRVVSARTLPPGWSGKLWALSEGVAAAAEAAKSGNPPELYLFTDADIGHHRQNLSELVARLEDGGLDLASLMVELHCRSQAEKFMIPAFVWFFAMLRPFSWVNDPAPPDGRRGRRLHPGPAPAPMSASAATRRSMTS